MKKTLSILLFFALIAFLVLAPGSLIRGASHNPYLDFWTEQPPEWSGRIVLWHIADFRTYQKSVTDYLTERANTYNKRINRGVHIEVVGLTMQKFLDRTARGLTPDAYSFPTGLLYAEQLRAIEPTLPALVPGLKTASDDGLRAVPYLYSGYFLVGNVSRMAQLGLTLPEDAEGAEDFLGAVLAASTTRPELSIPPVLAAKAKLVGTFADEADFKAGRCAAAVVDARTLGDILRAGEPLVESIPYPAYTDEVMLLGASKTASDEQTKAFSDFVTWMLGDIPQNRLFTLGALPASLSAAPVYDADAPEVLFSAMREIATPDPFLYQRHRDALNEEATRAIAGDSEASGAFFERFSVVNCDGF